MGNRRNRRNRRNISEEKTTKDMSIKEISKKELFSKIIIWSIQFIASIVLIVSIIQLNMLPTKYFMIIIALLVVFQIGIALFLKFLKKKRFYLVILTISVILSVGMVIASYYIFLAHHTVSQISGSENIKLDNMVVAVLAEDSAESIIDVVDYTFAVQGSADVDGLDGLDGHVELMVEEIEAVLENQILSIEYESLNDQVIALQNGEVNAIIYNEAYMGILEDQDDTLADSIKVIYEYGIEVEIEVNEESVNTQLEVEPFSVYISGIDIYGSISKTSRSDVNIIATVNPNTQQILLVTTPRDYYVTFPGVTGGVYDKLTHAGVYGVDVSMNTLAELYDTEINYYVRVNFTSLVSMVDALGGVTVYSSQSFQSSHLDTLYVNKGYNYFTGEEALAFSRERYNVDGGDYQRGENQLEVIKAMIEKVTSPSVITGATQLFASVSDNIDTNISTSQIQELIKSQIDGDMDWEIIMMSADATNGSAMCYSYSGGELFVSYPVESSVQEISEAIEAVLNGEILE